MLCSFIDLVHNGDIKLVSLHFPKGFHTQWQTELQGIWETITI